MLIVCALSAQDGAGDAFKVKKSALSQKIKAVAPIATLLSEVPQTVASVYSKEYLSELKAQTATPRRPEHQQQLADADGDISMAESVALEDISMELSSMDILPDPGETLIPSESSIVAAKQKRDRLRATGSSKADEDGFISLEVTKRGALKDEGPHPESRLMREDDDLGEGDDDMAEYTGAQERISLGKKGRKTEERKRRAGMIEMIEDAQEEADDEESREWEMAQVRRAADADREMAIQQRAKPKDIHIPAPIPQMTQIPTLGPAIGAFDMSVLAVTNSHAVSATTLVNLEQERQSMQQQEVELRKMVSDAETKRSWFAEFRDWVETVGAFLDEKFPVLEKAENEFVSLIKERRDMLSVRRRDDDEDDLVLFLGSSAAPPPPPAVDGEDAPTPLTAIQRGERRLARTMRRSARRSRGAQQVEEDGYSTDGSLGADEAADYSAALGDLDKRRDEVLSDVQAPEFRDPRRGLAVRFGEWREQYGDSYRDAFGGLGMVNAWEFWARLEVVGWNPLENQRGIDSFQWFQDLYAYSYIKQDASDEDPQLGPDGDLATSMVSTALLGRICKLLESGAFDPYNGTHVPRLVDIVESIEAALESEAVKFHMLLKAALTPFREEVERTSQAVRDAVGRAGQKLPSFDPQAPPARRRFLARRLKLLRNLVRWRKYSGERFGAGELVTRLLQEGMLPVAESGWDVGGGDVLRKAILGLPQELIPTELKLRF
ncbi:nineteen complex-related protein 2-domain-containing protein [Auriculariales sp. MPI-PUGE-AT-0066]|nr:nineteen complex-related protein 2-domain-containing protein [Auriculariales sp. MPI-PUGE-AT-0066]